MDKNYKFFFLALLLSFISMYLITYLNSASLSHVYFSLTRFYMATIMICAMALVMLFTMSSMYKDKNLNNLIVVSAVLLSIAALVLVRTQTPVDDALYMEAMIPHHSIAILTSEQASISDPEVRELADNITETQKREIALMKHLLEKIEGGAD